jgi:poly-gamma-glutamate synthase PgsB/CapB
LLGAWLLLALTALVALVGVIELAVHRRRLQRIPTRIHVNGTRGKSSVTRLIAAGLRSGGMAVCAKTSGALARVILPDGREYPVYRPAKPNVIEQVRIVSAAASFGAEVLVVECMALQPQLQWLSESKLVRATHGIITNARADHLDVMGPETQDVARALAGMVPRGGELLTAERDHLETLAAACRDRGTELVAVGPEEMGLVTAAELERFSYVEHAENVAVALRLCTSLGVDRETALTGMWAAEPDPGAATEHELELFGRTIQFVNGFAANDPESSELIWTLAQKRHPQLRRRVAVFNCRFDRPDRSRQLGAACAAWTQADHYVLVGTGTLLFARAAVQAGLDGRRIIVAEDQDAHEVLETIIGVCGRSTLVMGMGNISGIGIELLRLLRNRGVIRDAA